MTRIKTLIGKMFSAYMGAYVRGYEAALIFFYRILRANTVEKQACIMLALPIIVLYVIICGPIAFSKALAGEKFIVMATPLLFIYILISMAGRMAQDFYDQMTQVRVELKDKLDATRRIASAWKLTAQEKEQALEELDGQYSDLQERLTELEQKSILGIGKRGRKRGKLSSSALTELTYGNTVDDIIPFLLELKRAHDADDGSFARLCRDKNVPNGTARTWLKTYESEIERASNST